MTPYFFRWNISDASEEHVRYRPQDWKVGQTRIRLEAGSKGTQLSSWWFLAGFLLQP
jgi:hypothetical protein